MAVDLTLLGSKVRRYREQFGLSEDDVARSTGISAEQLAALESGQRMPSGDQILILADFFKCDYRFLISNDQAAPIDQTEKLFRRHGDEFSPQDRWAVQECLFLTECEAFLEGQLAKRKLTFIARKIGTFAKRHADDAARDLRRLLEYSDDEIPSDVFADFRRTGVHLFRRKLQNSNVSGVYLKHPTAGNCVIVNYSEDVFRQRFTVAHEAGHVFLDAEEDFVVSLEDQKTDLREVRANTFASRFLLPPAFLKRISSDFQLRGSQGVEWAVKLKVNTITLSIALADAGLITPLVRDAIARSRVPRELKVDAELPPTLSEGTRRRKQAMLERGLSDYYVSLCFEGYRGTLISAGRLAEMLLLADDVELREVASMYSEQIEYGD